MFLAYVQKHFHILYTEARQDAQTDGRADERTGVQTDKSKHMCLEIESSAFSKIRVNHCLPAEQCYGKLCVDSFDVDHMQTNLSMAYHLNRHRTTFH